MKKFLPLFLFIGGATVLALVYLFIFRPQKGEETPFEDKSALIEVPLENRPAASLIPSSDGHWLELTVTRINIPDAESLDYELLYKLPDGRTQGVPGTVKLTGKTTIERDLLLGSESSGKFRYDEGVKTGTLTLRFRNNAGKVIAKFVSNFHLQSNTKKLTSTDGKFTYTLDKEAGNEFFIVMETFGLPTEAPIQVKAGPYGVFKGVAQVTVKNKLLPVTKKDYPGKVSLSDGASIYRLTDRDWEKLSDNSSVDAGIFIVGSE